MSKILKSVLTIGIVPIVLSLFIMSARTSGTNSGYKPGDKAMNFSLKNIDGKMVSLSDYKSAKGFIVVFTCNHCPFAKAYESRIIDLSAKYTPKGYPVIAINPNDPKLVEEDSYDNMKSIPKEKKYNFPYVIDETQDIARAYGAAHTPQIYVLQKNGSDFIVKYTGAIDDNSQDATKATKHYVVDAVDALLSGKDIAVKSTKAVGCGIKWSSKD